MSGEFVPRAQRRAEARAVKRIDKKIERARTRYEAQRQADLDALNAPMEPGEVRKDEIEKIERSGAEYDYNRRMWMGRGARQEAARVFEQEREQSDG